MATNYAVKSMASMPFGTLIGGPLNAAVEAQGLAARSTVEFIQAVGFNKTSESETEDITGSSPNMGDVRNVTFKYAKTNPANPAENMDCVITVPILTIVPIPFIRIEEMTIDFNAKMTESITESHTDSTSTNKYAELNAKAGWGPVKVSMKAGFSSTSNSANSKQSKYDTEMTMNIHVRAVQDDMPAGLAKILGILESSILEKQAAGVAPVNPGK